MVISNIFVVSGNLLYNSIVASKSLLQHFVAFPYSQMVTFKIVQMAKCIAEATRMVTLCPFGHNSKCLQILSIPIPLRYQLVIISITFIICIDQNDWQVQHGYIGRDIGKNDSQLLTNMGTLGRVMRSVSCSG